MTDKKNNLIWIDLEMTGLDPDSDVIIEMATIITDAPVEFHVEDFRLKEWDKEKLKQVFSDLEFRTLGKRLLGEDFSAGTPSRSVVEKEIPQGVQTDLFGNVVESRQSSVGSPQSAVWQSCK